jgi:PAS domain S-box-containing protein
LIPLGEEQLVIAYVHDISERKRAEAALRRSEEYFRSLIENALDIIAVLDADGLLWYVSPSVERVLGYRPDELEGENVFQLLHPDDLQRLTKIFTEGITVRGITVETQFRMRHKDGSWHHFEAIGRNMLDDPSVMGVVVNARDITERKLDEIALAENEQKFREIFHNATDAIFLHEITEEGKPGRIIEVNDVSCRYLGYTREELLTMVPRDLVAPEFEYDADKIGKALLKNKHVTFENILLTKDGKRIPVEIRAHPFTLMGRKLVLANIRDMSERKLAEEVLRESEERYRAVFESTGTAMCVLESDYLISFVNHEFERITGYRAGEIEGKMRISDFIFQDDFDDFRWRHQEAIDSRLRVPLHFECRLRDKFDNQLYVLASMGVLPGTSSCVMSMIDVTWEKYYEHSLKERAEQMKDFLTIASHELRHPITIVAGYAKTLAEHMERLDRETITGILKAIGDSTQRLTHIIDELLNVSRIESGRFTIQREEVSLPLLIEEALEQMHARGFGNQFMQKMGRGVRTVFVDARKIVQLLVILLENAVNYSPASSPIEITAAKRGREIEVSVWDRGPGVPAEDKERIFERFFQVEDVLHHSKPGLGLGLYIAREIVTAHGGKIWYEDREGGGSIFRFTLPVAAAAV